jgi:hypothetical protein
MTDEKIPDPVVPAAMIHAMAVLTWIGPDYSMEAAMRLLYPEDAAKIYNPGKWPWGMPKE